MGFWSWANRILRVKYRHFVFFKIFSNQKIFFNTDTDNQLRALNVELLRLNNDENFSYPIVVETIELEEKTTRPQSASAVLFFNAY